MTTRKETLKFIAGWVLCTLIRLIPFRTPNFEPVLATQMPFAKKFGSLGGFVFGFTSIALYDLITGKVGSWTLVTGLTYGFLGVGAYFFFRKRESKALNYAAYGILGTLIYDAVTGLAFGPILFGQPFIPTLIGQIPFTLSHLAGSVVFSLVLSPIMYKWIVTNKKLEFNFVLAKLGLVKANGN